MLYGLADFRLNSALPPRRYVSYLSAAGPSGTATFLTTAHPRSPLLDLAAVRYVVVERAGAGPGLDAQRELEGDAAFVRLAQTPRALLYENLGALPRVRLVYRALPVARPADARKQLAQLVQERAHLAAADEVAFIEPDADGSPAPALASAATAADRVRLLNPGDPDRLSIEANNAQPAILLVVDTFYPGWRATVDGARVPLFPADLLFRAVYLPPGSHRVVLEYRSRTFPAAVVLCAAAAAACLSFAVRRRPTAMSSSQS